jgi:O-antigen ligase
MASRRHSRHRHTLRRLDIAAVAFAALLSAACLAKGAVHDSAIALLLLVSMPILWLALGDARAVHVKLKRISFAALAGFAAIIFLQYLLPSGSDGIWPQLYQATGVDAGDWALQDKAAWVRGVGRFLFLVIVFTIALLVGSYESSARIFFQALLISGAIGLSITFFTATRNGVPSTTFHSYTHGFVNANNAAAYAGIMLLVTLAQAARFFRMPSRNFYKSILNFIDGLSMGSITNGVFLAFSLLLVLAGLFMTGSRAGILLAILCGTVFCNCVLLRADVQAHMRKWLVVCALGAMAPILVWSFMNFGQVIMNKLATNGVSGNSRLDIYAATLPMIGDYAWLGSGIGSFPAIFQQYRPENISSDGIIDKAHNSYLEFAAEMGIPALLVLLVLMGWFGLQLYRGFRDRKERYITPALGLSVWLLGGLYSLVDFPLQVPGLAALFIGIVVICVSQADPNFSEPSHSHTKPSVMDALGPDPMKRVRIRRRRSSRS